MSKRTTALTPYPGPPRPGTDWLERLGPSDREATAYKWLRGLDLNQRPLGYESPRGLVGNALISRIMCTTTSNCWFLSDSSSYLVFEDVSGWYGSKTGADDLWLLPKPILVLSTAKLGPRRPRSNCPTHAHRSRSAGFPGHARWFAGRRNTVSAVRDGAGPRRDLIDLSRPAPFHLFKITGQRWTGRSDFLGDSWVKERLAASTSANP